MATSDTPNNSAENNTASLATRKSASGGVSKTTRKTSAKSDAISLYQPEPLPEDRPVAETSLDLVHDGYLPGNRPVTASHMDVLNDDTLPNHRPVMKSGLVIVDSDTLPNHRPIVQSSVDFQHAPMIMKRPVASNQIDNPRDLMGFLD